MLNKREGFARWVFIVAAVYGILVLAPQYLVESAYAGRYFLTLSRPADFYGFIGVALTWQLVFLVIASDVRRFRPLMLVAVAEKLSFGLAAVALFTADRIETAVFAVGMIDLTLGALFLTAFVSMRPRPVAYPRGSIAFYTE